MFLITFVNNRLVCSVGYEFSVLIFAIGVHNMNMTKETDTYLQETRFKSIRKMQIYNTENMCTPNGVHLYTIYIGLYVTTQCIHDNVKQKYISIMNTLFLHQGYMDSKSEIFLSQIGSIQPCYYILTALQEY
jgi:hypothetical protein